MSSLFKAVDTARRVAGVLPTPDALLATVIEQQQRLVRIRGQVDHRFANKLITRSGRT